jgi:hypothetical protein
MWLTATEWEQAKPLVEAEILDQIEGYSPQGFDSMVRWIYVPNSLELCQMNPDPSQMPNRAVYDLGVRFRVIRHEVQGLHFRTQYLQGLCWVPWCPEDGGLDLDAVEAFASLEVMQ